jgi:hypothetical protein
MTAIYLFLILMLVGLALWVTGAVLHKKATLLERKKREKQQEKALTLGSIAKIILIAAAISLVFGIMMLYGVKLDQ